jgi:hypothetical protein
MTVPEAAEALGISEGAVQSRIKRKTLETAHEGSRVFVVLGDDDRPTDTGRDRPNPPATVTNSWTRCGHESPTWSARWRKNARRGAGPIPC